MVAAAVLVVAACSPGDEGDDDGAAVTTSTRTASVEEEAPAQESGAFLEPSTIPEVVAEVQPSVVAIRIAQGAGSGIVFGADGLVVTNHHVVARAPSQITVVFADGRESPAALVASDERSDIAVLRTERRDLPAATFAEDLPDPGEPVIAIGNPLGFELSVTFGVISGLQRSLPTPPGEGPTLVDLMQTDAAVSPGNSGGALVDLQGNIVGMNVAFIPPAAQAVSIGFAIPAPTVTAGAEDLLENGEIQHAFLGAQLASLTPQVAERLGIEPQRGAVVVGVSDGGPADEAGVQQGDVIVEAGSDRVTGVGDLLGALRRRSPGDALDLFFVRDGEEQTVAVTLGERPRN